MKKTTPYARRRKRHGLPTDPSVLRTTHYSKWAMTLAAHKPMDSAEHTDTVRQQDAELVRELVEALQRVTTGSRMEGESEYRVAASSFRFADAALTRAQKWLEENKHEN